MLLIEYAPERGSVLEVWAILHSLSKLKIYTCHKTFWEKDGCIIGVALWWMIMRCIIEDLKQIILKLGYDKT
jgi:hypothetical protein